MIGGGGVGSSSEVMEGSLMVEVMVEVEMVLEMALKVFMLKVVDVLEAVSCYLILSTAFLCEKEERKSDSNTIRFLLLL